MKKRWIAMTLALTMLLSILPFPAMAEEPAGESGNYTEEDILDQGACGNEGANVTYTIYKDGHMVISGEGDMYDRYGGVIARRPWHSYSDQITSLEVEEGVTSLADYIFAETDNLVSVRLPSTMTYIPSNLFYGCGSLRTVEIPASITMIDSFAFMGCTSLESIDLPDSITTIEYYAFADCTALARIGWPAGLQQIGNNAFEGCNGLTALSFPDTLQYISYDAFADCDGLVSVSLPEKVNIDSNPFPYCDSLTTITVDSGNPNICAENNILLSADKEKLLCYPGGLPATAYTVPSHVKTLESSSFAGNTRLTTVQIGDHVTGVGTGVFADCTALTTMELPDSFGSDRGPLFSLGSMFSRCTSLTSVKLPKNLQRLGERIFMDCTALREVVLPESLTEVSMNAFMGCTALQELPLPATVDTIRERAFAGSGIQKLTIPAAVQNIYMDAFQSCNSTIIFAGAPPYMDSNIFENANIRAFYPAGCGWESSHMLQYGGTVRWKMGDGTAVDCGDSLDWGIANGVLTISGSGEMYDFGPNDAPWAAHRAEITAVVIESGVTNIGAYAFANCGNLTAITAAETVTAVGEGAFYFCGKLADVTLPGITSIGKQAFYSCDGLTAPIFPEGLTELSEGVFGGCAGFTEIAIPEGILTIGTAAFEKCRSLTSVSIPASVTNIGARPFDSCTSLTEIAVDPENTAYSSADGVLLGWFDGDLIQYPAGRAGAYTVPESVTIVSDHAFRMAATQSIRFTGESPNMGAYAFESVFAEVRYPFGLPQWEVVSEQDYGGTSIRWIPFDPVTGLDILGVRLDELRDLDFMAFSHLAYHDYTDYELGRTIGENIKLWPAYVWEKRDITYAELTEHIADWTPVDVFESVEDGYYAVLFRNGYGEVVLAYRGSIAILKLINGKDGEQLDAVMDWLVNDFPMEVFDMLGPQFYPAFDTFKEVTQEYGIGEIVTTGHSLGGALANIMSAYSGCRCESVNAISSLDTAFSFEPAIMGENFKGVNQLNIEDHANIWDMMAGVYEAYLTVRIKPYMLHESIYSGASMFAHHSIDSMLDRDAKGNLVVTASEGGYAPENALVSPLLTTSAAIKLGTDSADYLPGHFAWAAINGVASYGGRGNDRIITSTGTDQLIGGPGDDHLDGSYGNDIYYYYFGHGTDTIYDVSGRDVVRLYGLDAEQVTLDSTGDFVEILYKDKTIVRIHKDSRSARASAFELQIYNDLKGAWSLTQTIALGNHFKTDYAERIVVGCPVDIDIVDAGGKVVYTVEDGAEGEYYTDYGSFYVYLEENGEYGKVLDLREGYSIRIRGLDDGIMTVSHWEADGDQLTDNGTVENVPVSEGSEAELVRNRAGDISLTDDQGEIYLLDNTQNVSPRGMEYTIDNISIFDESGRCEEVPAGPMTVSVAVSNDMSTRADTLILGLYSSDGRMIGMKTAVLDIKKKDSSHAYIPLDNSSGEISTIRAFIVPTLRSMVPLAETKAVGDMAEEEPVVPEVPSVPGEVPGVPEVPIAPAPVVPVMAE